MKIPSNETLLNEISVQTQRKKKSESKGPGFDSVLKDAVEKNTPQKTKMRGTQIVSQLNPIQMREFSISENKIILDRMEDFIDMLEVYQKQLSDPAKSLRDMSSTVQQLKKGREVLMNDLDLVSEDKELKKILSDTLITASIEIEKFDKGIYI